MPPPPPTESTSQQPENPDIETETRPRTLPLDDILLELNHEEEAFFESETDTQDMEESRKHIIGVQEDAYKVSCSTHVDPSPGKIHTEQQHVQVYPHPCIFGFMFARLKISGMPAYPRVLESEKNQPDAIFLAIGCCRI